MFAIVSTAVLIVVALAITVTAGYVVYRLYQGES